MGPGDHEDAGLDGCGGHPPAHVHPNLRPRAGARPARANAITNQVYVVNPNIGALFGTGRSVVTDPEGRLLVEGGTGEEFLTLFLDLDLVSTVREHGTAGLNALWKQLRDAAPPFPPALLGYDAGAVMRGLGPLRTPTEPAETH